MSEGLGEPINFKIRTPLNDEAIREHIRQAHTLGLQPALHRPPALTIVAGGPSALDAPLEGPTLALNGALAAVFNPEGLTPTYYAACDPQQHLADMLRNPPEETIYYIASKCHPDVFAALKHRDVRIWDVGTHIPGGIASACSITLTALNLFTQLGYRDYDVWGWDACYQDGRHHAGDQPHIGSEHDRWIEIGDQTFHTTTTWAWEAETAIQLLPVLQVVGTKVTIHGSGMMRALRELSDAAMKAAEAADLSEAA